MQYRVMVADATSRRVVYLGADKATAQRIFGNRITTLMKRRQGVRGQPCQSVIDDYDSVIYDDLGNGGAKRSQSFTWAKETTGNGDTI